MAEQLKGLLYILHFASLSFIAGNYFFNISANTHASMIAIVFHKI